ncbi:(2Fe-2S)-binding protein [Sporosarcina siberiensis]|uniref:(2Fe-2S)-binding protein n=1 Tax=Sporosarcina siberiensis TaxID=1365606 RepID=A0ABW4SKQ8_9BACL
MHIKNHPILGETPGSFITIYFDEKPIQVKIGQTIASGLIANRIMQFGISRKLQQPRGLFCANGRCCSCFVTIDELNHVLSCSTLVEEGMKVYSSNDIPILRRDFNGD